MQTSRPSLSNDDEGSNPYTLDSAADMAVQLLSILGFTHSIIAGHSDGCVVAVLAAALLQKDAPRCFVFSTPQNKSRFLIASLQHV